MAGVIATIQEKLQEHPELSVEHGERFIRVLPRDAQGFAVELHESGGNLVVSFDGWHEEFEHAEEALDCFAMGLSDGARLKVVSSGGLDCNWTLETRQGAEWAPYSTTGLLFFPYWKRKMTRYLQNRVIRGP
jgi:hypothetical protein